MILTNSVTCNGVGANLSRTALKAAEHGEKFEGQIAMGIQKQAHVA